MASGFKDKDARDRGGNATVGAVWLVLLPMFERVLICTNLSDGLQRLIHFVPSLAAANIRHLTFLHCVPIKASGAIPRIDTDKVEQAKVRLAVAQNHVPAGMSVDIRVESGAPEDVVIRVAKETKADLMMMGYSVRNSISEQLFGSTALELYNKTAIPILSLRPQLISTYTTEELALRCQHLFRYLLLPYDDSLAAQYVLDAVKQRLVQQSVPSTKTCHLVWNVDDVDRRDIPQDPYIERAKTTLATVKAAFSIPNVEVVTEVRIGSRMMEVLEAALEPDVSAIAMSHHPRNSFLQFSVPSFTRDMLRHSWHPILYFPSTR